MSIIDFSALSLLRQTLSPGVIHLPDDPKYSTKRWALNAERQAAVVACPATPEDVVQILLFAQGKEPYAAQKRLHVAVKGGGHTPSGASSSDGGLVIDLQPNMSAVRVEPTEKLAYVGGGALWRDDWRLLRELSVILELTDSWRRIGWLAGRHGLVIDNLVQATVVTSSGSILTASESENSDLFWAIRGGGGILA
ncbi:FAD-binding domain protein [Rhizoctonia solani]|uniref:FAD-binding domain protein n=1 Tax=Rhizoctonia solani TaxID=456999 RepID=A0A8H8NVD1_9AGAM|nr:FAD-binding domain protein [Rhizoctonia solani]QRW20030.1 FAD-binding domain protein [Rhizoctonia solani]